MNWKKQCPSADFLALFYENVKALAQWLDEILLHDAVLIIRRLDDLKIEFNLVSSSHT